MPIYDYRCEECKTKYDVLHKVREQEEDIVCPSCGSKHAKKLMSISSVAIGGSSSEYKSYGSDTCETGGCCGGSCNVN